MSTGAVTQSSDVMCTSASPVQATGDVAASMTATRPVEVPGTMRVAPRPVEAPGAKTATRVLWTCPSPVRELLPLPIQVCLSLRTNGKVKRNPPAVVSDQGDLSDRDPPKDEELDQEFSEEANYRETMRGVHSFMGWHQIPDFGSSSSSLDNNPCASSRVQPNGKVSIKLLADDWLCRKLEKPFTIAEGYPSMSAETAGLLRDQFVKTPRSAKWCDMHTDKKDVVKSKVTSW